MAHARNMALWLVATIVLIVVFAMPSGAQAHTGHPHPGHPHAGPERIVAAAIALPASNRPASLGVRAEAVAMAGRAEAGLDLARPCDGACCRPGTSCCTGTALAPDTQAALPARRPNEPALAPALPIRADIVPEALPRPPRSFA